MAALICNIAKGREVEFYERVLNNDPTNSAFILAIMAEGAEPIQTLQDYDTLAAMLAGSPEVTNTNYARKTITALAAWAPDDSGNRTFLTLPAQLWSGPAPAAGDTWERGVVGYDPDTTAGTDSSIIPVTVFDVLYFGAPIVPNGDPISCFFSNGFVMAA